MNLSNSEINLVKTALFSKLSEQPDDILPLLAKIENQKHLDSVPAKAAVEEVGYYGNIWVRQNYIPKANTAIPGHTHHFDHVTLLVSGKVEVKIEGHEPKQFSAPTFIVINKDLHHEFKSLEDGTLYYCIFALRDHEGNVMDHYDPKHDPRSYGKAVDGSIGTGPCGDCKGCDKS